MRHTPGTSRRRFEPDSTKRMSRKRTLTELAKAARGTVRGAGHVRIGGMNTVPEAGPNEITWVSDDRFAASLEASRAGAVVVKSGFGPTPMPAILCEDPELGVLRILEVFAPPLPTPPVGCDPAAHFAPDATTGEQTAIGPNVFIGPGARIGNRCVLHPNVFIGAESTIGDDCVIWPGVVIRERCSLGNRVIIHPNAVIGADGFGYHFTEGRHRKIPQIGTVRIEDDVEIGANACIDRAKLGTTRVGAGTKIDNLVMVAHNVQLGAHCILAAEVGLAGSVRVGDYVQFGGRSGAVDHAVIGDRAKIAALAVVGRNAPSDTVVSGFPARDHRDFLREQAHLRRLPDLSAAMKDLVKRIEQLEATANHS